MSKKEYGDTSSSDDNQNICSLTNFPKNESRESLSKFSPSELLREKKKLEELKNHYAGLMGLPDTPNEVLREIKNSL